MTDIPSVVTSLLEVMNGRPVRVVLDRTPPPPQSPRNPSPCAPYEVEGEGRGRVGEYPDRSSVPGLWLTQSFTKSATPRNGTVHSTVDRS
jgi:hypothetical protein